MNFDDDTIKYFKEKLLLQEQKRNELIKMPNETHLGERKEDEK